MMVGEGKKGLIGETVRHDLSIKRKGKRRTRDCLGIRVVVFSCFISMFKRKENTSSYSSPPHPAPFPGAVRSTIANISP